MIYKIYVESIPLFEPQGGAMNWTAFDVDILPKYGQWTVSGQCVSTAVMSRHVTSWHRDILMTSQTQTSLVELLARIKCLVSFKVSAEVSWSLLIVYRVTRSEGWVWWYSLCFIVPLTPTIYSSPGASVCRPVLDCNWTLWPPISEYHRDHVMIVTPAPATLLCPLRMAIQWSEWSEWYQHQQWQLWSGDTSHPD